MQPVTSSFYCDKDAKWLLSHEMHIVSLLLLLPAHQESLPAAATTSGKASTDATAVGNYVAKFGSFRAFLLYLLGRYESIVYISATNATEANVAHAICVELRRNYFKGEESDNEELQGGEAITSSGGSAEEPIHQSSAPTSSAANSKQPCSRAQVSLETELDSMGPVIAKMLVYLAMYPVHNLAKVKTAFLALKRQ